jgi:Ca-activated chloride channel family protein
MVMFAFLAQISPSSGNISAAIDDRHILIAAMVAGVTVMALVGVAESLHRRRVSRAKRLAFGATGEPARWTVIAPFARIAGLGLAVFGATLLFYFDPIESEGKPNPRASRQVLVVLDVSPSMNISDAGPEPTKEMRGVWAGKVLRGILDRVDMKDTRVSLIAFYTRAVPMLQDSTDKELISGLMDGIPLYTAFKAGETDMQAGIDAAFRMAKPWPRQSTTLVVIGDGDLTQTVTPRDMPASIADAIVIGVGDPVRPTTLAGHSSKQDAWALKTLAAKLGGYYHDGNTRQLPSEVVAQLASISPRLSDALSVRELGLTALGVGALLTALIGPALMLFGRRAPASSVDTVSTAISHNTLHIRTMSASAFKGTAS